MKRNSIVLIVIMVQSLINVWASDFDYKNRVINFNHKKVTKFKYRKKAHVIKGNYYQVDFKGISPVNLKRKTYRIYYYKNTYRRKDAPTIMMLPPSTGVTGFDYAIANYCQSRGYNIVILPLGLDFSNRKLRFEDFDKIIGTNIEKIRGTIDILPKLPGKPNPENIFSFGVSLGAIASVFALELEPRLNAGVVYMGGSTMKDIFETVKVKGETRKLIIRHKRRLGIETKKEFREFLDENILLDLDTIPYNRDPDDILMFIAVKDYLIKTEFQYRLREQMGNPKFYKLYGSHFQGALIIPTNFNKIDRFFKKRMK